jgi:hypothetical protein
VRALFPYFIQLIAAAIILAAVLILVARLPPITVHVSIQARDISVSGDY